LDRDIKNRFTNHTREGQYATGGSVGGKKYSYLPNEDISKIVLKSKQVIGEDRILDGAYIKGGKQKEKFTDKYKFPIGSVVWDKTHKRYGVVLNNFGNEFEGDGGEIRLDSDGVQPIFEYDKKFNRTEKYNLVPYGSKDDKGDGDLLDIKESGQRLIDSRKERGDEEYVKYYQDAFGDVIAGKIDGKPFKVNSEKVIGETSTGKSIYQKYTSMPDLSYEELKEASDIHKKFSKKAKTETEKETALKYSREFMRMANEEKFAKGLGKYAKGGGVSPYYGGMSEAEILKATVVYDNGGETLDRYTVFTPDSSVFGMSATGDGFNQYIGDDIEIEKGSHLGKRLKTVPKDIKSAVLNRMIEEEFGEGGSMYKDGGSLNSKYYTLWSDEEETIKTDFDKYEDALSDFKQFENSDQEIELYEIVNGKPKLLKRNNPSNNITYLKLSNSDVVVEIEKRDGKWVEGSVLEGEEPYGWGGKTYMDYLKPNDIVNWLNRDYKSNFQIIEQYAHGGSMYKKGGNTGYTYVPNADIEKIIAKDGKEYGQKVLLDGAYVTDKVRTPKMSRTQFEDETYSFGNGGNLGRKGTYTGRIVTTESGDVMIGKISGYRGSGEPVYDVHKFGELRKDMREKVGELSNNQIKQLLKKYATGGGVESDEMYKLAKTVVRGTDYALGLYLPDRTDFFKKGKEGRLGMGSFSVLKESNEDNSWSVSVRKYSKEKGGYYDLIESDLTQKEAYKIVKNLIGSKYGIGGGVDTGLHGKFGDDNPRLVNFDIEDLDQYEEMVYNDMKKSNTKAATLQVIINTVEGDYTQLSPELAEIAEEQFPSDQFGEGGNIDKMSDSEVEEKYADLLSVQILAGDIDEDDIDEENELTIEEKRSFLKEYADEDDMYAIGGGINVSDIKKEKQKMVSELFEKCGVFFAFSDKQFEENKTPLKEGEKYVSIGGGGYLPKGKVKKLEEGMEAIERFGKQTVKKKNLVKAEILDELQNHECFYTGDISDVVDLFEGTYTKQQIRDVYNKHREANQEYALGGSISDDVNPEDISFLQQKGYYFDGEFYFEADGEFIEVIQGSSPDERYKVAVLFRTNEIITISREMLDKISTSFGKNYKIELFTNAGVDLRSSAKGKYKNISVHRLPQSKMATGGEITAEEREQALKNSPKLNF
jgi:hypothetical protein